MMHIEYLEKQEQSNLLNAWKEISIRLEINEVKKYKRPMK
jgi:hypothetical protein